MSIMNLRVLTRKIEWTIPITGKFTFIQGNSGTGKTTLCHAIETKTSKIYCDMPVKTLHIDSLEDLQFALSKSTPHLYIMDEDSTVLTLKEAQSCMVASKHFFLIVSRLKYAKIPYGIRNILEFRYESGKITGEIRYKPTTKPIKRGIVQHAVIEDSGSGLILAQSLNSAIRSSDGKANIPKLIRRSLNTLYIADGCGFGSEIEAAFHALQRSSTNQLYLWESFEHQVLISEWLGQNPVPPLDCPNVEEYFEHELKKYLRAVGAQGYSKSTSVDCITGTCCHTSNKCKLFTRKSKAEMIFGPELTYILQCCLESSKSKIPPQHTNLFGSARKEPAI